MTYLADTDVNAAIGDSLRLEQAQQSSGVDPSVLQDLGYEGQPLSRRELWTYPTAANKDSEFICGCTIEVDRIPTNPQPVPEPEPGQAGQMEFDLSTADKSRGKAEFDAQLAQMAAESPTRPGRRPENGITLTYLASRGPLPRVHR